MDANELFKKTLDEFLDTTCPKDWAHALTAAERRTLEGLLLGVATKDTAAKYNLSPETVRQQRKSIYRKLGYNSAGRLTSDFLGFVLKKIVK